MAMVHAARMASKEHIQVAMTLVALGELYLAR